MDQNEVVSSSRAEIYVVPPPATGDPFLLGVVEDFSATGNFQTEVLKGIGHFIGVETLVNSKDASFRWGKVKVFSDAQMAIVAPVVAHYSAWRAYDILIVDIVDGKPAIRLKSCGPTMLETTMTLGRALRENYSGVCIDMEEGQAVITSS